MRNDRTYKMHDRLPIQIFQLKNYEELCKHRLFNYSFFILPHEFLLSGLSYFLNYEDRLIIFHLSRCLFQRIYESHNNILFYRQIQYTNQLVNDSFSKLISVCHILYKNPNIQIHLNHFGTNPVEHNFGMIRLRSKDHHKVDRFIKEASKINALRQLREDMVVDAIAHRDLQFGRIINTSFLYINLYYIEKMAFSLIQEAKTQKCDEICVKTHNFFIKIIEINSISCNKCYLFKSNDVLLAPNANVMIEKRQNFCCSKNTKCKWKSEEIELLIRLNHDLNGNLQLMQQYFPKRTIRSVENKLKEIQKINTKKKRQIIN